MDESQGRPMAEPRPDHTGLRWVLAIMVAAALTFTGIVVVLHGGADPGSALVRASTRCSPPRLPGDVATSKVVEGSVSVGDVIRTYRLTLPPAYDGVSPVPMVILLHGTSGTVQSIEDYTAMVPAAGQRGYAVLTPQGLAPADGSLPTHWTVPGFDAPGSPDDVAYVGGLVDTVTRAYCVDASRVFATGISGGAAFATVLACKTDLLSGVAAVAGLNLVPPCQNAQPVSVLAIHGTDDSLVAYDGLEVPATTPTPGDDGSIEQPTDPGAAPSAATGGGTPFYNGAIAADVARWAAAFGCSGSTPGQVSSDVATETYTGCRQNVTVALWTVQGGGHTWPGASTVPDGLGFQTESITATEAILDAFDSAPSSGTVIRPSV